MPGMDGKELSTEIQKINQDVKIILTSGYQAEDKGVDASDSKISFLQKPVEMETMLVTIRELLDSDQ